MFGVVPPSVSQDAKQNWHKYVKKMTVTVTSYGDQSLSSESSVEHDAQGIIETPNNSQEGH